MRISLFLFVLLFLSNTAEAQFSVVGNRIPQQLLGGAVGGAIGGVAGGLTGRILVGQDDTGWEALGAVVAGVGLGANMGEALLPFAATSVMVGSMVGYNLTRTSSMAFLQPSTTSGLALVRTSF